MKKIFFLLLSLLVFPILQAQTQFLETPDSLHIELGKKYAVDWNITVTPVISTGSAERDLFDLMIDASRLISESDSIEFSIFSMLCRHDNCTKAQIDSIKEFFIHHPLPAPLSWFYVVKGDDFIFGMMDTSDVYKAHVSEACVKTEPLSDNNLFLNFRFDNTDPKDITTSFEDFTTRNIAKDVVFEINGEFVMAPKIYSPIEDESAMQVSVLLIPSIVKLFFPDSEIKAKANL